MADLKKSLIAQAGWTFAHDNVRKVIEKKFGEKVNFFVKGIEGKVPAGK